METDSPLESLMKAVQIVGSQAAMSKLCGVSQPAVFHWLHRSKKLPAEHVLSVERETGISKHLLRPDVYGESPADLAAVADTADAVASNTAAVFDRRSA